MKKIYAITSLLLIIFLLQGEKREFSINNISSLSDYYRYYTSNLNSLSRKHSAKLFSLTDEIIKTRNYSPLLKNVVIIDTSIVGKHKDRNGYYIRTASRSANNLLCELKCSRELYYKIARRQNPRYLIAVKTNSLKASDRVIELDSIDNRSIFVNRGENFLLNGECLDAVELPYARIFSNE